MGLCNKGKRRVCAKKEKDISIIEGGEKKGIWVYWKITKEKVYYILKVASNNTSVFCKKEGW